MPVIPDVLSTDLSTPHAHADTTGVSMVTGTGWSHIAHTHEV